jgi:capsular exopolysaccharide synthesis family protein
MATTRLITNQDDSDLKQLVQLVARNYKIFIIGVVVAVGIAFLAIRFMTPNYKVSSSLLIKEDTQRSNQNMNDFLNSSLLGISKNFQNELWVLKSTPVIEQTIRNLDLTTGYYQKNGLQYEDIYGKAPFRVLLLQNHIQPLNVRFRISVLDNGNFEIKAKAKEVSFMDFSTNEVVYTHKNWNYENYGESGKLIESDDLAFIIQIDSSKRNVFKNEFVYSFVLKDAVSLTDMLKKQLGFKVIDKLATVIEVVLKTPSVIKGKDILNEIMAVYSQQNLDRKNHAANIAINYIEKQLSEISDSLSLTEDNLQKFRSSNQLLNAAEQATGISTQYMDLQNQMAELVTRKRYYDYVADYLSNNEDFSNMIIPASMGIPDQLLTNLMSELITAQAQRSNLVQNNQELNPMVQRLTIQIENAKKTISENITAVRKTLDISLDEMNKRIRKVEASISRLPVTQRQLGGIERKYRLNDAIYNYLLEKRAEAKITQASNMPDNIIIEPAKMVGTRPVSPNVQMIYLMSLLLGLAMPFGFLTLKNAIDNKIESQETIERLTNSPVLGKIMHNNKKTGNVIFEYPRSVISESFRALRTNLEYNYRGIHNKVILVTSCIEGEGKSFSALNLAMSYAQLGLRTLLIDFDLRKISSYFEKPAEIPVGLSTYYLNGTSHEELILHSPYEKLDYIETGPIPPNPMELLALNKTETLLKYFKNEYECIILDSSPLAQVSDAYLLMDYSDIKIVVARYNYSLRKVFALIMKDLKQKNLRNVCVVLNDNKIYSDQYGYGYGYNKKKK